MRLPLLREERVTISRAFQTMLEVREDSLDYFLLSDGKIGLYLGDVSGKGLPAAPYAALGWARLAELTRRACRHREVLNYGWWRKEHRCSLFN